MTGKALMEQICQLGQIHLEGNIVPPSWYQHLKYPSGKPYHIAITLLSEIVYWFRPRMLRDEHTGDFLGWAKKFKGDGIQRSYAAWGAPFGFTKRESADAMKYLVTEGLITTEIRDITLPDGTLRPNVVVVTSVQPARLREITYSRRQGGSTPEGSTPARYAVETEGVVPADGTPPPGYNPGTEDLLPATAVPSPDATQEGATPNRKCLESNIEIIHETNREILSSTGTNSASMPPETPERTILAKNKTKDIVFPPATITTIDYAATAKPIAATSSPQSTYPAILVKAKARRAVLELGQRPTREDLAYPNVTATCAWAARCWHQALVTDPVPGEMPAVTRWLDLLEAVLGQIREQALRDKQLTFTQILDDYLGQDEVLRATLRTADSPAARLAEFAAAVQDILSQWNDAPQADDLASLKQMLGDEEAA